ncbi:Uu.00g117130.m01.CDS01 [Anthostomella pinea]|uniref:Uu.00g117130.m01.CDS01 n=1 Tax=Anthostomella pinea TaxID=933095 RepID=A0AAI8YGW5_9PEZI|nr:Uu.00g117130.m01.CDS01 [Anthostomella pinea]
MTGGAMASQGAAAHRRAQLTGKTGISALMSNKTAFGVAMFASIPFVYFFIPETRGKTLEEMDAAFGSHTSEEDMAALAQGQEQVGIPALLDGSQPERGLEKEARGETIHVEA